MAGPAWRGGPGQIESRRKELPSAWHF